MQASDDDIIARILAGEGKAYALLVERHKDKGMALAYRMLRSREDAEEALQDAFIRAFRSLGGFEQKASFSTWFYRILFNVCATRLSRKVEPARAGGEDPQDALDEVESPNPLPDVSFTTNEAETIIRQEIDRLPEVFGVTFHLFAVQEKSYEEIVEITGVPLGTVKARLFRARAMLRRSVGERLSIATVRNVNKEEAA